MQGWNEQTDWEDGGDWPGRPDNGAAYPAVRAGHPDDLSRSSRHPGTADPHHRPDPDRSDQRTEPAWSVNRPDPGLPDRHPDLDLPDQRPDPDWSDEPDHHRQYPDGGWQDEPARTGRRTGAGWSDEPTDLGAFALGRDPGGVPARRVPSGDRRTDAGPSDRSGSGRHRRPTPLRGPVGLGIAVTALLGLFGVGAALLPPSLADAPAGSREGQPAVEAAGPEQATDPATPEPSGTAEQTATPTPTTTATRPAPKPKATTTAPKSPRTSSPAARRTPARSGSGGSAAGSSQEAQVLAIVNRERAANGCAAVVVNSDLAEAARLHSQDQGEHTNMSHTGSDGSDFVERARRAGYDRPIGENVAMGYENAAAVMDGWMNSSGHRANILNCDARAMGVGVATGADGRLYWTQVFGAVA
ncbi:CAP domain-containing protein [Plantactinospora sp. CA-294935]|uniref:CAP domain-containing protein n=1 Tax=Plantactinospora sp. CA-294935 TaxID=3240012 RepID=UPI003D8DD734